MQALLRLIDAIYESALDPDRWPDLLEQATCHFSARGAQIGNTDLVNSRLSFSLVHGYDWSADHMRRYESLMSEDPRLPYFTSNPFKAVHCRMGLTDEALRASRVYREVLAVGGVEYSLGVNLVESERALSYFLLLRDASMPPFDQADCEQLEVLIPHLARALRLQREMDTVAFEKQVGFSALDSMALGVLVVDQDGRLQFANSLAHRMLARADGLRVEDGVLRGQTEDGSDLGRHVRAAIASPPGPAGARHGALRLKRARSAEPYLAVVSPLKAAPGRFSAQFPGEGLAALFVRDADHAVETRVELLQRLYGLTGSEARLTDLIALGKPLKKVASALGVTEGSARQYIKQVFRKTGVHGQPDLVRKVMNLPPSLSLDGAALGAGAEGAR
jgi:DNA-binding CsgD family transcriptional regulator/glutaredoxin-related protein